MKRLESHGVTFFHNGDFSGDVHMQHERGPGFVVPGAALKALFNLLRFERCNAVGFVGFDKTGQCTLQRGHDGQHALEGDFCERKT